jgi:hypothetical protein
MVIPFRKEHNNEDECLKTRRIILKLIDLPLRLTKTMEYTKHAADSNKPLTIYIY